MKPRDNRPGAKRDTLRQEGTLNRSPEKVRDPKFQQDEFFDPRDVVQVRYEMLRRVCKPLSQTTSVMPSCRLQMSKLNQAASPH